MATFALIHGAWHSPWAWEPLEDELRARGHRTVAPDLRGDDPARDTAAYAQTVVEALDGAGEDIVVVGHSLGGLTAPVVAAARPVRRIVYLCALLPVPGVALAAQFADESPFTPGAGDGRGPDDEGRSVWDDQAAATRILYGMCEPQLAVAAFAQLRPQASSPSTQPCPLPAMPDVPVTYILARHDGIISPDWSRRAAPARLGVTPLELESDHSPMLSCPGVLATALTDVVGGKPTP
jgi:pimeloyl-ACP methyl ester carboxylesterase